ncbi:unnamed protein product [Prorocentrum cordatum]|uniref:Uncharacterized protein n=1 Tax=Prorocentrum cordatum TaxID=2364126 RepID=A0ABN9VU96_9DINO|nr:unnamed protein product [Polarella glacialis]
MAASSAFQATGLQVIVRNTFIDVDDPRSPKCAARSSSTPPSFKQILSERNIVETDFDDCSESDAYDGTTEHSEISSVQASEDQSFPDTDDEWEAGSGRATHARRLSDASGSRCIAPRDQPAGSSPLSCADGTSSVVVGVCYTPIVNLIVCPSVPSYRGDVVMASNPGDARPASRRCTRCRSRKGANCPCASSQAKCLAPAVGTPTLPGSHAHAISVKNVLVDAEEAPKALAETSLKVSCAGGQEGIVVERLVQRSPLSGKAREWLAARGAAGPAAPAAGGRTKLSSAARAWQPTGGDAAPARAAPAAAEPPRERSPEPPAPSTPQGAPKFGSALLRCLEEVLRKSAFVAGVDVSAGVGGRWCVRIDIRRKHLYLKEHVLACAQEALFDVLDELQALRASAPLAGRCIPATVFNLKVECPSSS